MSENKNMNYYYQISDTDSLTFKPTSDNSFELFIKGEATSEMKIGVYEGTRWNWEDDKQRELFMYFLKHNPKEFSRAFKSYWFSKNEGPTVWECAWRRFKIKVTKRKRKAIDSFYETVYPTR